MTQALRQEIIANGLKMNSSGLNQGTSGNLSVRYRDGLLITPAACPMTSSSRATSSS